MSLLTVRWLVIKLNSDISVAFLDLGSLSRFFFLSLFTHSYFLFRLFCCLRALSVRVSACARTNSCVCNNTYVCVYMYICMYGKYRNSVCVRLYFFLCVCLVFNSHIWVVVFLLRVMKCMCQYIRKRVGEACIRVCFLMSTWLL